VDEYYYKKQKNSLKPALARRHQANVWDKLQSVKNRNLVEERILYRDRKA